MRLYNIGRLTPYNWARFDLLRHFYLLFVDETETKSTCLDIFTGKQRQHLIGPKIANCAVPHLLKKANCTAECTENCQIMQQICSKYSPKVRCLCDIFIGSNWLQLSLNDVVGHPHQTYKHQKQ